MRSENGLASIAREQSAAVAACGVNSGGSQMKQLTIAVAFAAMLAAASSALAQTYPARQITMIVPFPPGGSTDVPARIIAERMRPLLGQPVIVENVGGAGGSIALGRVARAAPDG